MKHIDINVYNSLKFIKENALEQYEDLIEQYFTTDITTSMKDVLNEGKNTIDLKPNGSKIRVNDSNKEEFVRLKSRFIGYLAV